jgi:hypothetical protein
MHDALTKKGMNESLTPCSFSTRSFSRSRRHLLARLTPARRGSLGGWGGWGDERFLRADKLDRRRLRGRLTLLDHVRLAHDTAAPRALHRGEVHTAFCRDTLRGGRCANLHRRGRRR